MSSTRLLSYAIDEHLNRVKEQVRNSPEDVTHRLALTTLLTVRCEHDKALRQAQTLALLDDDWIPFAQTLRNLIQAEQLRDNVFAGRCSPLVLGEPQPWMGIYLQALQEPPEQAARLRTNVQDALPSVSGRADQRAFSWLCDGDSRLGPCFELILNGAYYWVPATQVARMDFSPPDSTLDLIWTAARVTLVNGGKHLAYMPSRYPISATHRYDDNLLLGHRTEWSEAGPDNWHGHGRRTWLADGDDLALFGANSIEFDA